MKIPSEDEIRAELHKAMDADPKLKCCASCVHYARVTGYCEKINKTFPAIMYGCKHHITAEERLIKEARENLMKQARDCEKIEFLLAIALTSAAMTTMFVEDFERRIKDVVKTEKERKDVVKTEKERKDVRMLRKDLELADQMKRAMKNIGDYLKKIDSQYRLYIQSQLDKIFKKEGVPYNAEGYDNFLSDAGEFCTFILEMARVAHHNEGNMNKVYEFMAKLTNKKTRSEDVNFCLDPEDIKHYKVVV
jgi:hypothetical protein